MNWGHLVNHLVDNLFEPQRKISSSHSAAAAAVVSKEMVTQTSLKLGSDIEIISVENMYNADCHKKNQSVTIFNTD